MTHDYTDGELTTSQAYAQIKHGHESLAHYRAFLHALPERPQAAELFRAKQLLATRVEASRLDEAERKLREAKAELAAVVEARIIKALRAVPNMDLYREYAAAAVVSEDQLEAVRARLIAAVKGEGEGQDIKGLKGLTKERCLRIAEIEGDSTVAAGQPDVCPHAAPHVFCETCKVSPCPIGIPAKGEGQAQEVPQVEAKSEITGTQPVNLDAGPSNVMIDLETLGTNPGCVILSIGAVLFGNGSLHEEFYIRINLKSAQESGLTIDADTLQWWTQQPHEVFTEAMAGGNSLDAALFKFRQWLENLHLPPNWTIWSNGASFDAPVLEAAFRKLRMQPPWTHVRERCFRTLRALDPSEPKVEPAIKHHALEDAKAQALHALRIAPWL